MAKRLTLAVLLISAAALTLTPGCSTTSAERITALQTSIDQALGVAENLDAQLDVILPAIEEGKALLDATVDAELAAQIREDLDKLLAEAAQLREYKGQVEQSVTAWKQQVDALAAREDVDVGEEIALWGQGITQISPSFPPPYQGWLALAGLGVTTVGGVITALRERAKRQAAEGTTVDIVRSVDIALESATPKTVEEIKSQLKIAQNPQTRQAVSRIKSPKQ